MTNEAVIVRGKGVAIRLADGSQAFMRFDHEALAHLEQEYGTLGAFWKELKAAFAKSDAPEEEEIDPDSLDPESIDVEAVKAPDGPVATIGRALIRAGLLQLTLEQEVQSWKEHPDWPDQYLARAADLRVADLLAHRSFGDNVTDAFKALGEMGGGSPKGAKKTSPKPKTTNRSRGAGSSTSQRSNLAVVSKSSGA